MTSSGYVWKTFAGACKTIDAMNIRTIPSRVASIGGVNLIIEEVERKSVPSLIRKNLGNRKKNAQYGYAEVILGLIYSILAKAGRLEDVNRLRDEMLSSRFSLPSADVIGRVIKNELSVPNIQKTSDSGMVHDFSLNPVLNTLMLEVALLLGTLRPSDGHVLDYDNTCLHCEKHDSTHTYKGDRGYQPGVAWIGKTCVYIEGRNGNNTANFAQKDTLERCLNHLLSQGIKPTVFRADAASYQKEVIGLFRSRGIEVFIRADNKYVGSSVTDVLSWKPANIGNDHFEIGECEYSPFGKDGYRLVYLRRPSDEVNKHTGLRFLYRAILTDNLKMSALQVIDFYNQRGAIEKNFDAMNNDWCWSRLPFSFLNENTAYMLITGMGYTIYEYLLKTFSDRADFVKPTARLKAFREAVINVKAEWEGDDLLIHDMSRNWASLFSAPTCGF